MTGHELSFSMCLIRVCVQVCVSKYILGAAGVSVCVSARETHGGTAVAIFILPPEIIIYTHSDDTAIVWTVSEETNIDSIILTLAIMEAMHP